MSTGAIVGEEDLIKFLRERDGATLDEISSALKIPKYGPNSAYAILYSLKSKNIVERRGNKWTLTNWKENIEETSVLEHPPQGISTLVGFSKKLAGENIETEKSAEEQSKPAVIRGNKRKEGDIIKTGTILDKLFLGFNGEPLEGLPAPAQFVIAGPLGAGKSLLASEVAIKMAHVGFKVLYAVLDDVWKTVSKTFDLESRLMFRAKALGLDWNVISNNIYIVNPQQINEGFFQDYEKCVRDEFIDLAVIDPVNRLEDLSGHRLITESIVDIINLNRLHGVTGILIKHTSTKSREGNGELLLEGQTAYFVDGIIEVIPAQVIINGNIINFGKLRAIKAVRCKLCGVNEKYILAYITHNGLIKPLEL